MIVFIWIDTFNLGRLINIIGKREVILQVDDHHNIFHFFVITN